MRYETLRKLRDSGLCLSAGTRKGYGVGKWVGTIRVSGEARDAWSCGDHQHTNSKLAAECANNALRFIETGEY